MALSLESHHLMMKVATSMERHRGFPTQFPNLKNNNLPSYGGLSWPTGVPLRILIRKDDVYETPRRISYRERCKTGRKFYILKTWTVLSHKATRGIIQKCKSDLVTPLTKSHQWLPIILRIKSKYFSPWSLGTLPTSPTSLPSHSLAHPVLATPAFWLLRGLAKLVLASGPLRRLLPPPGKLLV